MSWLRNRLLRWLGLYSGAEAPSLVKHNEVTPLPQIGSWENPKSLVVVPVKNGFLICNRIYNPNGPDNIEAIFAPDADALGPMLIAEMTAMRLKK